MNNRISLFLAAMLVAVPMIPAHAATASYDCNGGTRLTANFSPPSAKASRAILNFADGGKVTLPQQLSADGGRYANARMEFWIKGNGATLTRSGRSETCHTR